jgi:branched-chain amino acid transport system substrate-binding protein
VPLDSKGSPQETLPVFKQVTDQNLRYAATMISSVALALTDAVAKHNAHTPDRPVLFLDCDAREPSLTEPTCTFWHFRFLPHSGMQPNVLTGYIARQPSVSQVFPIDQDYGWGQSVSRHAVEMHARKRPDIKLLGNDLVRLGKVKDFSPSVAKIVPPGKDAVLTPNSHLRRRSSHVSVTLPRPPPARLARGSDASRSTIHGTRTKARQTDPML